MCIIVEMYKTMPSGYWEKDIFLLKEFNLPINKINRKQFYVALVINRTIIILELRSVFI